MVSLIESQSDALERRQTQLVPVVMQRRSFDLVTSLLVVLLLSLLVGLMAYQNPASGRVAVGWLGDRLFLGTTSGLGADAVLRGDFFADDLTPGSPTGRSRWTRQHARVVLPNLGSGADLKLTLLVQGWPDDVLDAPVAQPTVAVLADGTLLGSFQPTSAWASYELRLPATARTGADLTLDLEVDHTFTDTASFGVDPRPKGIRLAEVRLQALQDAPTLTFYPPAWRALGLMALGALLLYLLVSRWVQQTAAVYGLTTVGVGLAGIGLAVARIWMGAILQVALLLLLLLLLLAWRRPLLLLVRALVRRFTYGLALGYGLVTAALVLFGYALAELLGWLSNVGSPLFVQTFPDSLLYGLLGTGVLALVLVLGREGLPRLADAMVNFIGSRRGSLGLLWAFGLIWIGYQAWVVAYMPYLGHADYSDNAVVARNLAQGRGWVVDYVTQFYYIIEGTTRPQETWPLLQPVWIVPFFLLFGPEEWAAKLPNLLFNLLLLVLIYQIGTRLWDRRVGLTAAIFVLTNYLFFRLTIYVTSDLAFVVFSVGAIYCLYRAVGGGENREQRTGGKEQRTENREQGVKNREQRAGSREQGAGSRGQGAGSREQGAGSREQGTENREQGAENREQFPVFGSSPPASSPPASSPPASSPPASSALGSRLSSRGYLLLAGVLTGLMMLQKPSGAMLALGMGLWFLAQRWHTEGRGLLRALTPQRVWLMIAPVALWTIIALVVLSPYLARNLALFGKPVYSTESYDAWVLGYRGNTGDAWEEIYRVFVPELGGPGRPDRSWILRWGFDKTLEKFEQQVMALRDYIVPVWYGLPAALDGLVSANERRNIAAPIGAWLALIGCVGALRFRRRILGLLLTTYTPYVIFMLTYWRTNEERYWVILIPWLALLGAWALWAGYDALAALGDRRWAPLGLILVGVLISGVVSFSRPDIAQKVRDEIAIWQPDLDAYAWLTQHTTPGAVVMTRIPWQLHWHTERPAVMIPNTGDRELLLYLAQHYNAQYLVLENQQRVKGDAGRLLAPLLDHRNQVGQVIDGFELIYASPTEDFRAFIYRFPQGASP
ncbi:ArnT family glycosyltransferase [Candidatus Viridilinea mediisalina]|uniref:ArnT family glycosyltransferase n=1 Tax=Candidatus Viridilinea mediisalina TaxID=2024553 RepID=UPI001FE7F0F8|nr:glycosyltransferase family 39 protein [Candidatus Viridilinea mediisalina]